MIVGLGSDLCRAERIATALARPSGARFAARVFTPAEMALADARPAQRAQTLAKRWAAKEACAKALGTGFRGGIAMTDIEVTQSPLGAPQLLLHGAAAQRLVAITPCAMVARLHLTLTDEAGFAQAFVVIEAVGTTGAAGAAGADPLPCSSPEI